MDYLYVKSLKENHPTIRLLNADNCPLIISFLFQSFKQVNKTSVSNDELVSSLTDYLYFLRSLCGDDAYPETAQNYLDKWANDQYLRKYYPQNTDEAHFELTAAEKALEWLKDQAGSLLALVADQSYRNTKRLYIKPQTINQEVRGTGKQRNAIDTGS